MIPTVTAVATVNGSYAAANRTPDGSMTGEQGTPGSVPRPRDSQRHVSDVPRPATDVRGTLPVAWLTI